MRVTNLCQFAKMGLLIYLCIQAFCAFNKILKLESTTAHHYHHQPTSSPASEEEGAGRGWSADPNRALVRAASAEMSVGDDEVSATLERPQPNECWNRQFLLSLLQLLW